MGVLPDETAISTSIQQQAETLKGRSIDARQLLYPSNSSFTPGKVEKHPFSFLYFGNLSLFVMGDDPDSLEWAKKNAPYLKKIHAFGILTNVKNEKALTQIEAETGLMLTPADLSGFDQMVGTQHYPFLINEGWVRQ